MPSNNPSDEMGSEEAPTVPASVLEGIENVLDSRTTDGEELDEALGL